MNGSKLAELLKNEPVNQSQLIKTWRSFLDGVSRDWIQVEQFSRVENIATPESLNWSGTYCLCDNRSSRPVKFVIKEVSAPIQIKLSSDVTYVAGLIKLDRVDRMVLVLFCTSGQNESAAILIATDPHRMTRLLCHEHAFLNLTRVGTQSLHELLKSDRPLIHVVDRIPLIASA